MESATNEKREKDKDGRFICGELNIKIDKEGRWYYNNSPIGRKALVKLFSSVIEKDTNNAYWLVTPAEKDKSSSKMYPLWQSNAKLMEPGKSILTFEPMLTTISKPGQKILLFLE